ncbi:MAG TPA: MBL fold metallo-hydrolase [Mycobacteriales bacterium]|nr:MBL fold metallo-hydrolase [Mycobacteriales bacterium]
MAALTIVRVLFCGQGMTNLVEVYDDGVEKAAADWLALVDCGGNTSWGAYAVAHVVAKVKARTPKRLDCIVVSHQDDDHIALLKQLGPELKKLKATVGLFYAGGLQWSSASDTIVHDFLDTVGYPRKNVLQDGAGAVSDYVGAKKRSELTAIASHGDTSLRRLMTNVNLTSGPPDIKRNASSTVVAVDNGTNVVLLPGDATYETMSQIYGLPAAAKKLVLPVFATGIPHHGALRTAVENYVASKDPKTFGYAIVDAFASLIGSQRAAASAGPYNGHKHPIQEVLMRFYSKLTGAPQHTYVSYIFQRSNGATHDGWTTWDSKHALDCTVVSIGEHASGPNKRVAVTSKGVPKGPFVFGDIKYLLAATGVLRPEEMVEFVPRGTFGPGAFGPGAFGDVADEGVVYAPAP